MKTQGFLKHGELEQDFELNIASIIDCFVVLIAFVLISTSFFSISILDAQVSGGGAETSAHPEETVVIEMNADRSITLKHGAGGTASRIAPTGSDRHWDLAGMSAALGKMKTEIHALDSAILVAENSVTYRDVMASMEAAKTQVARVNLGGF